VGLPAATVVARRLRRAGARERAAGAQLLSHLEARTLAGAPAQEALAAALVVSVRATCSRGQTILSLRSARAHIERAYRLLAGERRWLGCWRRRGGLSATRSGSRGWSASAVTMVVWRL
jgi:hypothetical protein